MDEASEKVSTEADDSANFVGLGQELEALQSIYINEIEVKWDDKKSTFVSIDLYPATADNHDEQYVRMTLKFKLNEEYPHSIPEISIHNARGLSEEKLNGLMQDLALIAENKIGNSMLFEIIEAAKEHLTNDNRPYGECSICLYGFSEDDVFTKTECYHYFHSHCLARYVKNANVSDKSDASQQEDASSHKLLCPMCRLPIHFEGSEELYPLPSGGDEEFVIDEKVLEFQKRMADMYQKQVEKGGIIDIEAEKNKYLLEISNVPTRVNPTVDDIDSSPETDSGQKSEETDGAVSQEASPKNMTSKNKDMNPIMNSESKNKDFKSDGRAKSYDYNKQSRNNFNRGNSHRGNQRYNRYSKTNASHFEQRYDRFSREETGVKEGNSSSENKNVEKYSEDLGIDASSVSQPSFGSNSYKFSSQRKERTNYYDTSKRYNDGYNRGNYSRYPNSGNNNRGNYSRYPNSGNNRGRRYAQSGYGKPNYREQNFQDRKRQNSEGGATEEKTVAQADDVSSCVISRTDSAVDEDLNEKSSVNDGHSDDKLSESMSKHEQEGYSIKDTSNNSSVPNRKNSFTSYDSSACFEEENSSSQMGKRDSYRRGKQDRGYRNQYSDRQNASSYRKNNQNTKFSQDGRRNFNRQARGSHSYRHSYEDNSLNVDEKDNDNGYDYPPGSERNRYGERNVQHSGASNDRFEPHSQRRNNHSQVNASRKSSNRDFHDEDCSYGEKNYRYNSRNRSNYPNRNHDSRGNWNGSERFSYQDKRDTSKQNAPNKFKYQDIRYHKDNEECTFKSQVNTKLENCVNKKEVPDAVCESTEASKATATKNISSEFPCDDATVPCDVTLCALDSNAFSEVKIPDRLPPPPGFSNPLKKVVYGLQAANPPPGFPRS